jgi:hypothetical protein
MSEPHGLSRSVHDLEQEFAALAGAAVGASHLTVIDGSATPPDEAARDGRGD